MAALTRNRLTKSGGLQGSPPDQFPVASGVTIYQGALLVLNASGNVEPATTGLGLVVLGRAEMEYPPSTSAGEFLVRTTIGVFNYASATGGGDDITAGDKGAVCYLVDDQTVALTDGGGRRSPAGTVNAVDGEGVWVEVVYSSAGLQAVAGVGGSPLAILDEGVPVEVACTSIDAIGSAVTFTSTGPGAVAITATGGGTGDVQGPAGATDFALAIYNLTTGKVIQNSGVVLSGAGANPTMSGLGRLELDNMTLDGSTIELIVDGTLTVNTGPGGFVDFEGGILANSVIVTGTVASNTLKATGGNVVVNRSDVGPEVLQTILGAVSPAGPVAWTLPANAPTAPEDILQIKTLTGNELEWAANPGDGGVAAWNANPDDVIYADSTYTGVTEDGSPEAPFKTLQGGIDELKTRQNALPIGNGPGDRGFTRQILRVASANYDEDVTVPANMCLLVLSDGPWILGDGAGRNRESTTPRSWTTLASDTVENADSGGIITRRPQLVFRTLASQAPVSSTQVALEGAAIISGDLVFETPGGVGESSFTVFAADHLSVAGDVKKGAGGDFGLRSCVLTHCFFDQAFDWDNANLNVVEDTEFDGLVTVASFGRMTQCEVGGGMTVRSLNSSLPPNGLFGCKVAGVFTCLNPLSFKADAATLSQFSGSLAGGATIDYLDEASGVGNDSGVAGDTVKDALDTLAAAVVQTNHVRYTLPPLSDFDSIMADETVVVGNTIIAPPAGLTQPATPRTLFMRYSVACTAGILRVTGVNASGNVVTDDVDMSPAAPPFPNQSVNNYARVTQVALVGVVGPAGVVSIGPSQSLGLPLSQSPVASTLTVTAVSVDEVAYTGPLQTLLAGERVQVTSDPPNGARNYDIWYAFTVG